MGESVNSRQAAKSACAKLASSARIVAGTLTDVAAHKVTSGNANRCVVAGMTIVKATPKTVLMPD